MNKTRPIAIQTTMNERASLEQIKKLQSKIASHKKVIERFKGNESLISVEQYLKDLEARLLALRSEQVE